MKTMMTHIRSIAVATIVLTANAAVAEEAAGKTVTLQGKATCAKCDLGTAKECASVLQVKEGDKTVTYYLSGMADKAWHKNICTAPKNVTVTGTVSEKDGKMMLDASKNVMNDKATKKEK